MDCQRTRRTSRLRARSALGEDQHRHEKQVQKTSQKTTVPQKTPIQKNARDEMRNGARDTSGPAHSLRGCGSRLPASQHPPHTLVHTCHPLTRCSASASQEPASWDMKRFVPTVCPREGSMHVRISRRFERACAQSSCVRSWCLFVLHAIAVAACVAGH
jgi:hypothetical protein